MSIGDWVLYIGTMKDLRDKIGMIIQEGSCLVLVKVSGKKHPYWLDKNDVKPLVSSSGWDSEAL